MNIEMNENILFYKRLQKQSNGLVELLSHEELFSHIPEDWCVFVVDIENSTQAVQEGKHEEVNLSATGSIVTVLNEIKKTNKEIRIPYFFGGDGTTFLIPRKFQKTVLSLLENYRHHVQITTSLILRVGCIEVAEIYKLDHKIKIAKFAVTKHLTIPIVLGTGLRYAEKSIKSLFVDTPRKPSEVKPVNLTGMECRWKEIELKEDEKKIICLIVDCSDDHIQADVFKKIIEKIDIIFGNYKERNPISNSKLQLDLSIAKIKEELKMKFGEYSFFLLFKTWIITAFGNYYFKIFKERVAYLRSIPLLSDTLMIDGVLHTVFSGTQKQIDQFMIFIDQLEKGGKIIYGINITHSSIMSCYVEDRQNNHIHFVDGTEGGYTKAAVMFKSKILEP